MPSREVHRAIDRIFLGKEYDAVHAFKDRPAKWLGPRHRKVRHDQMTNIFLGLTFGLEAYLSAVLHDLADFTSTEVKRRRRRKKKTKGKRRGKHKNIKHNT